MRPGKVQRIWTCICCKKRSGPSSEAGVGFRYRQTHSGRVKRQGALVDVDRDDRLGGTCRWRGNATQDDGLQVKVLPSLPKTVPRAARLTLPDFWRKLGGPRAIRFAGWKRRKKLTDANLDIATPIEGGRKALSIRHWKVACVIGELINTFVYAILARISSSTEL
jgi:hypothetical protein